MNREIKFRAWDKKRNKLLYFDNQGFNSEYCLLSFDLKTNEDGEIDGEYFGFGDLDLEEEDTPVMQFTGLKDRNGVEIYEGDILEKIASDKSMANYGESSLFKVEYKNGYYQSFGIFEVSEVIGNIYENSELLK